MGNLLSAIKEKLGISNPDRVEFEHWLKVTDPTTLKVTQGFQDPFKVKIVNSGKEKTPRPRCVYINNTFVSADAITFVSANDDWVDVGAGTYGSVSCQYDSVEEAVKARDQIVKYVFGDRLYVGPDAVQLASQG